MTQIVGMVRRLRQLLCPVYRHTVINYLMRGLSTHTASLRFARVGADGEYLLNPDPSIGGLQWDMKALENWYYRRFLGDHPELCTGNQRLLDEKRARWGSAAKMLPHYNALASTCVAQGICVPNPAYDPADLGDDGVPLQPRASPHPNPSAPSKRVCAYTSSLAGAGVLWVEGEEYRVISFDETKLDDSTGEGRKGRCEHTVRCGPLDDGECVGNKHGSRAASGVGGSNGLGEAMPCMVVTASETMDSKWWQDGPVAVVNGQQLGMHCNCNAKGSVNGEMAIEYVRVCVLGSLRAHGKLPTAERKAILVCDGVGTHLTEEFLDFLIENHFVLVLRTPNCSQKQQPEDLYNFWLLKNAKAEENEPKGFYVLKQAACLVQMAKAGSGSLPYDVLFSKCLKPSWEALILLGSATPLLL